MKYAVFITSHNSSNKCETLDTLLSLGYKDDYYIVIDSTDKDIENYKLKYNNHLKIFDKHYYMSTSDSGHGSKDNPSACVLYARNYIEDEAKKMNLDAFIMCDDDITNIIARPLDVVNKKILRQHLANNITEIFYAYLTYLLECKIDCLGFGTPNFYFSGYDGLASGEYLSRRSVSNLFFRNCSTNISWIMPMEDFNTATVSCMRGHLFLSPAFLLVEVRPQYTQKGGKTAGGMSNYYAHTSSFTRAFYSTMLMPSACQPAIYKDKYIPKMSKDNAYPKIISGSYAK